VTDATRIEIDPPAALLAVEVWSDAPAVREALPPFGVARDVDGGWRALGVEPSVWWLSGPLDDRDERLASLTPIVAGDGNVSDLTGGFVRIRITGRRWRSLLMIGGVFDAEDPAFAVGRTVGTLLHHVTVRYDVVAEDVVAVWVAPSYADHLIQHLRLAAARLDIMEPFAPERSS
jgi:heterotetrameric sarcosine oxidase gamma subunit